MGGGGGGVEETKDQVVEQQNNTKLWQYYQETYKPYIDKTIALKTGNAARGEEANKAAGQVNAEVMKGVTAAANSSPVQPNAVNMTRTMNNAAGVEANAQVDSAARVKRKQMGDLQNIIDIGRGQQTDAQQGQANLAQQSLDTALADKQRDLQTEAMWENTAGSLVGAGAAGYKRTMSDPGSLYKDASGNINNVDFEGGGGWGTWANGVPA